MPDILARDVNGRPLRAGDSVRIVSVGELADGFGLLNTETTIRGPCPISPPDLGAVEIHVEHPLADVSDLLQWWSAMGSNLKRLDEPDWDEVEETTGYRPEEVESCV